MDQDLQGPNNFFQYQLSGEDGSEQFFQVNPSNGLVTVSRSLRNSPKENFVIFVTAVDNGQPPLSSIATVSVTVDRIGGDQDPGPNTSLPNNNLEPPLLKQDIRFAMSQYSTSVSESVKAPFFLQVLPVNNKPPNPTDVQCSIISGNYEGVFTIETGAEGNCELRTRAPLDREVVDQYLLNVSVSAPAREGGQAADFGQVSVVVLDTNDNSPEFVYNYEYLDLKTYFGAVSADAPPFTTFLTIQAKDDDLGNNSVIRYDLDPMTPDSQYFKLDPVKGDLTNAKTLSGLLGREPQYFEFSVDARDNPTQGRPLVTKGDVVVNLITDANRFLLVAEGIMPDQTVKYVEDMTKALQVRTEPCTLLGVERLKESAQLASENKAGTDIIWYAINPATKTICTRDQFRQLFSEDSVQYMRGQMSSWFRLGSLSETVPGTMVRSGGGQYYSDSWDAAPVALIVLAAIVAVGSLLAIFAMCYFWSRFKASRVRMSNDRMQVYAAPPPKYNALILPPSEKEYETQMVEVGVTEEELLNGKMNGTRPAAVDLDFTVEEGIYSIQAAGARIDPFSTRHPAPAMIIPPPDYDNDYSADFSETRSHSDKKTMM